MKIKIDQLLISKIFFVYYPLFSLIDKIFVYKQGYNSYTLQDLLIDSMGSGNMPSPTQVFIYVTYLPFLLSYVPLLFVPLFLYISIIILKTLIKNTNDFYRFLIIAIMSVIITYYTSNIIIYGQSYLLQTTNETHGIPFPIYYSSTTDTLKTAIFPVSLNIISNILFYSVTLFYFYSKLRVFKKKQS